MNLKPKSVIRISHCHTTLRNPNDRFGLNNSKHPKPFFHNETNKMFFNKMVFFGYCVKESQKMKKEDEYLGFSAFFSSLCVKLVLSGQSASE